MILVKTPLRIGLAGGGSDLPSYNRETVGICVNATIDKYVYVMVKKRYDNMIYLKYSENEVVEKVDDIKHDFIREAIKHVGIEGGIEIINWADIPTKGTGLGSSSSFLVGLLKALYLLKGQDYQNYDLACEACEIEIHKCKKEIGFQDQFSAAIGGLNRFEFNMGNPKNTFWEKLVTNDLKLLEISRQIMMFYTGITRESTFILDQQSKNMLDDSIRSQMDLNVECAKRLSDYFLTNNVDTSGNYEFLGESLLQNWNLKKKFQSNISNAFIDTINKVAINNGAIGGKITGAGAGGFYVCVAPISVQEKIKSEIVGLSDLIKYMPIKIDPYGSRVLMNVEEYQWG